MSTLPLSAAACKLVKSASTVPARLVDGAVDRHAEGGEHEGEDEGKGIVGGAGADDGDAGTAR